MTLKVGIVNNMPPAALESTERQFRGLLLGAMPEGSVDLRWFRLVGARPVHYDSLDALWSCQLDGLIVTGAEPRAEQLSDEPVWRPMTKAIEWAAEHTYSTIWSCLAAHAAVLHLDGVQRRLKDNKIFGLCQSFKMQNHALLQNLPDSWETPHSRRNDLPETELAARGYSILAKSRDAGVDLFAKDIGQSLFVFIQTHPEYSQRSLLREYQRDLTRYDTGQQAQCPSIPRNYLDERSSARMEALGADIRWHGAAEIRTLEEAEVRDGWRPVALQLYRNWLDYLAYAASVR